MPPPRPFMLLRSGVEFQAPQMIEIIKIIMNVWEVKRGYGCVPMAQGLSGIFHAGPVRPFNSGVLENRRDRQESRSGGRGADRETAAGYGVIHWSKSPP
jgi:hypothetical protein